MLKIYKTTLFFIIGMLLYSCGGSEIGKVLRNEKTKTTDEFLVKKREPLVLPPDYNEIPKPGSIEEKQKNEKDKMKEILKVPNDRNLKKNKSSNIEESILDKIRK